MADKDYPSKSEVFGTFDTLSDRLDFSDTKIVEALAGGGSPQVVSVYAIVSVDIPEEFVPFVTGPSPAPWPFCAAFVNQTIDPSLNGVWRNMTGAPGTTGDQPPMKIAELPEGQALIASVYNAPDMESFATGPVEGGFVYANIEIAEGEETVAEWAWIQVAGPNLGDSILIPVTDNPRFVSDGTGTGDYSAAAFISSSDVDITVLVDRPAGRYKAIRPWYLENYETDPVTFTIDGNDIEVPGRTVRTLSVMFTADATEVVNLVDTAIPA